MSLVSYFRDRRMTVVTVAVTIAAILSQLLLHWLDAGAPVNDFVGPPRSGYTLYNVHVTEYDVDGLPGLRVQSPHIDRREGDESLYLNTPTFQMPSKQPGVPDWQGNSPHGWVNKDGTLLKLQGAVYMFRPAYALGPMATLTTSEVTGWPKENRMETAELATMTQGQSVMNGVGMRANLTDNHLELLHEVHGIIYPSKRNAKAQPAGHRHAVPAASVSQKG